MDTTSFQYTSCYCEENIWHLAQRECFRYQLTFAVLVSGKGPFRNFWCQRNAEQPQEPVLWDYHAILLTYQQGWWIWDLDTTLETPVAADVYLRKTFLAENLAAVDTDVYLRLIPASDYVARFSSDRAHMKLPSDGWLAPPPEWPVILGEQKSNLMDWLDVEQVEPGRVLTLAECINEFGEADK